MKKIARSVAASFLLAGLLVGGEGLWIYAKAKLAQMLLELSWRSEQSGRRMRPWPWADTHPVAKLRI
jgi:sortase A